VSAAPHAPARGSAARLRSLLSLVPAIVILAIIGIVANGISTRLDRLGSASGDGMVGQLARLDTDHGTLLRRIDTAQTASDLAALRMQFDQFQSRLALVRDGRSFAALRADPAISDALDAVLAAVAQAVPLIEAPDAALLRALPDLRDTLAAARPGTRQIVQAGVDRAAPRTDVGRIDTADTLRRLGLLTIALLGLLLALSTYMWQLYRTAQDNAAAAARSAARMAAVVDTAPDGVAITDGAGIVRDFNAAAEHMFGRARDEVTGRMPPEAGLPDLDARAPATAARITIPATRASGRTFPLELSTTRAQDPDGAEMRVHFMRDITTRADTARDMRAARDAALAGERAKQRLLTVLSHEMRAPLETIRAAVDRLRAARPDPRQADDLSAIAGAVGVLLRHVDDVLDIARTDSGSAVPPGRPIDLNAIIRDVVAEHADAAARNGTTITVGLPDHLRVTGDPVALRHVLTHLLENAVAFTAHGAIDIAADRLGTGDMVEIALADTGIGIAPDDHARIFEDFVTGDDGTGAGLGLGVVQRLVRQMGGEIGLESEPGEGSLFWLRLPLPAPGAGGPGAATDDPDSLPGPDRSPLDILVVEDNAINRQVVREMLTAAGHDVTEAADGAAGLAAAQTRRFDLILMDVGLPGLDGVDAARRIRGGHGPCRDTPIVALTANALLHEVSIFRDTGTGDPPRPEPPARRALDRALASRPDPAPAEAGTARGPDALAPVLDRSRLDALRREIGRARADALLARFVDEADRTIDALVARGEGDLPRTLAEVHKLAGSAAMFGAARLHGLLRDLDAMGKAGQADAVPPRLRELRRVWRDTRPALHDAAPDTAPDPAPGAPRT